VENPAPFAHPIHELLARRWSARAIDPAKPVARETLLTLLEAARWAPSSSNEQPWRFLVFDESVPAARDQARSILTGNNALWAVKAPVLVLTVAKDTWTRNGQPNRHAAHDVGAATGSLLLQVAAHGLVGHPMAGYGIDEAKTLFGIPDGFTSMAMVAIGHPGPVADLPEPLLSRETQPRVRKPIAEIAFAGAWEKPLAPSSP